MPITKNQTVLVIGASRGLGLAIAGQYIEQGSRVVATVRGDTHTALHDLIEGVDDRLEIEHLDFTEPSQIAALHERLSGRSFDLLFVVAGITNGRSETPVDVDDDVFGNLMLSNALSPIRTIEMLGDLVSPDGTIAIMSSGQGSVAGNTTGDFEIYRASKSALNQLMRSYAVRHRDDARTLLLMAPGWVKTELGGPDARLEIEESIPSLVTVVDAQRGHGGLQYLDYRGKTVAW